MLFHTLGTTLAPFISMSLVLPGGVAPATRRTGPLSHWPSGGGIPARHRSGALPAPPSQCEKAVTPLASGLSIHVPPLRHTAWAGGGARIMGDKFLGSARLPAVATRTKPRGLFPSLSPRKALKASSAKCIPRLREEGGTYTEHPGFSRVTAFER